MFAFFDGVDVNAYVTPTGSSAGATITTDANGTVSGTFAIPDPNVAGNPRWRTGRRIFRLTTNSKNSLTGDLFSSAEVEYVAKGMIQNVRRDILSTREPKVQRTNLSQTTDIVRAGQRTESYTEEQQFNSNNNGNNGGGGGNNSPGFGQGIVTWQGPGHNVTNFLVTSANYDSNPGSSVGQILNPTPNNQSTNNQGATSGKGGTGNKFQSYSPPSVSYGPACGPHNDPIAQSFLIDRENGLFATSIDIFFSSNNFSRAAKSSSE